MEEPPTSLDKENVARVMACYDTVLLDCDGVLWGSDHVSRLPGVGEAVARLRDLGKQLIFVTNNSEYCRQDLCEKIRVLGGFEARPGELFPVAHCAALYLKHVAKITGRCYVIGGQGMAQELSDMQMEHVGSGPDHSAISADPTELLAISKTLPANIEAVLLGYDIHFSFTKQFKAASFLLDSDCQFLACNEREVGFRLGPRCWRPGAGTIVPCISMASGRQPTHLGKPHKLMLDSIRLEVPEIDLKRTVMVGDSLKTDVLFAKNCGIHSIMVLSGANKKGDMYTQPDQNNFPTFLMDSIEVLKHC